MAMLGGGLGSFIGGIHHLGAQLAGIELVAGVFSVDAEKSRAAAAHYGIDPARCYPTSEALFAAESARADGIDIVAIATPNHLHLPAALQAIAAGINIISDKPATASLAEALTLRDVLAQSDCTYALTFSYVGYPMVREARARVANGEIGTVRKVVVTYSQGWMAAPLEQGGNSRAAWRTDPAQSGVGGCIADLGVHAFNLAEFVSGQTVTEILPDLNAMVANRALDDDCNILARFANDAVGIIMASQIAFGERNAVSFQIYGDAGAVHWAFDQADMLKLVKGGEVQILSPMSPGLLTRAPLPPAIGNGLITPFALLYRDFAAACAGDRALVDDVLPGIEAGVRSMRFVERAVKGSAARSGWTTLEQ
jgi:predicted dehydrogenase